MKPFLRLTTCLALVAPSLGTARAAEDESFFESKVAPRRETRCYECPSHESGKMKGGLTLDSRLGWEPSMEYMADGAHLRWKMDQVRHVIDVELPAYRE